MRLAGASAVVAGLIQITLFFADGAGFGERNLIFAWNLLQIPLAAALWWWLNPRARTVVTVASVSGIGSLVLWSASAVVSSLAPFEAAWIGLAAIWWLGIGYVLLGERRVIGLLTIVVGLAAVGDFIVTVPEMLGSPLPDLVFVVLGGFKVPFSVIWTIAIGTALIVNPPVSPAGSPDLARGAEEPAPG